MNTDNAIADDDADLDTAPDGSTISSEHIDTAEERERDAKGRFVKDEEESEEETTEEQRDDPDKPVKGKKPKTEVEEEDEEEEDAAPSKGKKTAAKDAEEEEEEEEEEEAAPPGKPNRMSQRMIKLAEQRDAERREKEELRAQLLAERAARGAAPKPDAKSELDIINEKQDALYEEVEKARADGDTKMAAKLQREIDANNRKIGELEVAPKFAAQTAIAVENDRFNTLLDTVQGLLPELDPNSDSFNREAAREVEFQITAYENMGMKSSNALRRAVLLLYQVDPTAPPKIKSSKASGEEVEEKEDKPLKKPTNVKRNLDAVNRLPPKPDKSIDSVDEGEIDVNKLSDEEFDALPDSKLDELGGSKPRTKRK